MNDDTIPNDGVAALPDDAAGQEVEVILLVPHDNSVPSIVSSLAPEVREYFDCL